MAYNTKRSKRFSTRKPELSQLGQLVVLMLRKAGFSLLVSPFAFDVLLLLKRPKLPAYAIYRDGLNIFEGPLIICDAFSYLKKM